MGVRQARAFGTLVLLAAFGGSQSCSDGDSSIRGDGIVDLGAGGGGAGGQQRPDASAGGDGGAAGAGFGGTGTGAAGSGGMAGSPPTGLGDAGADASIVIGGTVQACPGATLLDPTSLPFPSCDQCADATCVPDTLLTSIGGAATSNLLAACDATTKCVPNAYVATTGSFQLQTCTAFGAAEGRCVSRCIPQVANQVGLEQDVCGDDELCAPCYMPTDGAPTGACGLGCDPGPQEPPFLFESCCADVGVCVPAEIVPASQRGALRQDTCTDSGALCTPSVFVDPGFRPAVCVSIGGAEGRCIASCVGAVASRADYLPTAGCGPAEVCAPCYDPGDGALTGACDINGDAPTEPPVVFAECCSGAGRCVPASVVPDTLRGALTRETCASEAGTDGGAPLLCAPASEVTGANFGEGPCSFTGAFGIPPGPGACYDPCTVPGFAALAQEECATGRVCLPCFLADGSASGACDPSTPRPSDGGADAAP